MRLQIFLLIFAQTMRFIHAQSTWEPPYITVAEGVTLLPSAGNAFIIEVDENNPRNMILGTLTYKGDKPFVLDDESGKLSIEKSTNNLLALDRFDYEIKPIYSGVIMVGKDFITYTINIGNLNDNPITIRALDECKIDENLIPHQTTCSVIIEDLDGLSDKFKLEQPSKFGDIFQFDCELGCKKDVKSEKAIMTTLKYLDFEETRMYSFDLKVHDELPSSDGKLKMEVSVNDKPDMEPKWTAIFASQQFDEQTEKQFNVSAVDGDVDIDAPIMYECSKKIDEITCEKDPNENLFFINVARIDRDKDQTNTLEFTVTAYERDNITSKVEQSIIFIINDLNNNWPVIKASASELTFYENKFVKLNDLIKITAEDRDMLDKGTFSMSLKSDKVPDIDQIFQIIPDNAYQEGEFSLSIINAEALDYENEKMRNFDLKIVAIEKADISHFHEVEISIKLENWNDETPRFDNEDSKYEIRVPETIGRKGEYQLPGLEKLIAYDTDEGDKLDYKLVGSSSERILQLKYDRDPNGTITLVKIFTKEQNNPNVQLFDYENDKKVELQLEVRDTLDLPAGTPKHRVYAELIINLDDVNDETPSISMNMQSVTIDENLKDGYEIKNLVVTGEDLDEDSVLEFGIDWDKSYATKYGVRVDKDFKQYQGCFVFKDTMQKQAKKKEAIIVIKDKIKDNTPDYELFDTIYLSLYVKDTDQTEGTTTSEAVLIVYIQNVNDEEPIFNKDLVEKLKQIIENSDPDVLIGTISASDKDIDANITYSLEPIYGTPKGLVKVDPQTGDIRTDSIRIDAEAKDDFFILEYNIIAKDNDETHTTTTNVLDDNDIDPKFVENLTNVEIKEHSPLDLVVFEVKADDKDRDNPNNQIIYTLENDQAKLYLQIDQSGKIIIKNDMDREGDDPTILVKVMIKDNPDDPVKMRSSSQEFTLTLLDINDKEPSITTDTISTSEDMKKGAEIASIEATDMDDPNNPNSEMELVIVEVLTNDNKLDDTFFTMTTTSVKGHATAKITLEKDLRKYFGKYKLRVRVTDKGDIPKSTCKDINLEINKFSFGPPVFTFPVDGTSINLKPGQDLETTLQTHLGSQLDLIKAEHEVPNKYEIEYSILENGQASAVFAIKKVDTQHGKLVLKSKPDEEQDYGVTIVAIDEEGKKVELNTRIRFIDKNAEPTYSVEEVTVTFTETEAGVGHKEATATATYKTNEGIMPDIHYFILSGNGDGAFICNISTGELEMVSPLWVLNMTDDTIRIVATQNQIGNNNPRPESVLTVKLDIIDINDNAPKFDQQEYFAGIMTSYDQDKVVRSIHADDLDEDGTTLTYSIDQTSFEAVGNGISTKNKFNINPDTGDITLGFDVKENMDGYFGFDVEVTDSLWKDKAKVKIYIIVLDNLVRMVFENTKDEVVEKKKEIEDIMTNVMEYKCTIQSVAEASDENGLPLLDSTEVKVSFVDLKTNMPVEKDVIMSSLNIQVQGKLRTAFMKESLTLQQIVEPNVQNADDDTLFIVLISVSVILGSCCVLLITAFILKTRSLTSRINKLSAVEFKSNESLHVAAAPNTNRRAAESSNPIFNTTPEVKEMPQFDNESISSADSDLIGIENNDFFMN